MIKNLLAAADLEPAPVRYLLAAARAFAQPVERGETIPLLQGKTVVNLFFENSTRTRTSFEVATRKLGGASTGFSASTSSVSKGETLLDTARTLESMRPHCWVIRHSASGAPGLLARHSELPVVNAGDGFHEHPTQGLLDAFTLQDKLGDLKGKRVVIIGDIAHSRVARSNIHVLKALGASVAICAPPTLLPPKPKSLGVDVAFRPEEVLGQADAVMALRIQSERQDKKQLPTLGEYARFWGLTVDRVKTLRKNAVILHPGPMNRGVEIAPEVADGPRSVIFDQVANGVLVRMAVLAAVCNPKGLENWLKKEGHHA